jgi:hypothetical protein
MEGGRLMAEPEMVVIKERAIDPLDQCQFEHPMVFCKECGTWMNCKREGIDADYRRREEQE